MKSVVMNMLRLNLILDMVDPKSNVFILDKEADPPGSISAVCYPMHGKKFCFPLDAPWSHKSNVLRKKIEPSHPEDIHTQFYHYDRNFNLKILDDTIIDNTKAIPIVKEEPVKIVSHGFMSSCSATWAKIMLKNLRKAHSNVFCVDWRRGAQMTYPHSATNIRVVGAQLGHFIYLLHKNFAPSSVHVIGHSLGAHMAGHAGQYLKTIHGLQLDRITGLDPAGPLFNTSEPALRLDEDDASFVDVIQTGNSPLLGLPISVGINQHIGHIDVFPNGGKDQTGCNDGLRCNHIRGAYLFSESVRKKCNPIAVNCDTYENFKDGQCWDCEKNKCTIIGDSAMKPLQNLTHRSFFLETNNEKPYCGSNYRITIKISNSTDSRLHGGEVGNFMVRLRGKREKTEENIIYPKKRFFEPGETYRRVFFGYDIGNILRKLEFKFFYTSSFINPISWRIRTPVIYLESVQIEKLNSDNFSWKYCFKKQMVYSEKKHILIANPFQ